MPLICLDTETGGLLPPAKHCLLSCAAVFASDDLEFIGGTCAYLRPAPGALLAVPPANEQFQGLKVYATECFVSMDDLSVVSRERGIALIQSGAPQISAYAAQLNGFIGKNESGQWSFPSLRASLEKHCLTPHEATKLIMTEYQKATGKTGQPLHPMPFLAHNASFDTAFIEYWMPELKPLAAAWFCTMSMLRAYNKVHGISGTGTSTLSALNKCSGHLPARAHEAYDDAMAVLHGFRWLRQDPSVKAIYEKVACQLRLSSGG